MEELHCRKCFQHVSFKAGPCPRCGHADPIGFRKSFSDILQAIAVMIIAVCVVR